MIFKEGDWVKHIYSDGEFRCSEVHSIKKSQYGVGVHYVYVFINNRIFGFTSRQIIGRFNEEELNEQLIEID